MIRLATERDGAAIAAIYAPYVQETAISFELAPPDADEMATRIERVTARFPWIVYERDGTVLGYAYAMPFRDRPAYQWTAETSVYVAASAHGQGIGKALYKALFALLEAMEYQTLVAVIALPNEASVRLHEAMGFKPAGVLPKVGHKFGRWTDVGFWTKPLREASPAPFAPLPLPAILGTPAWNQAVGQ